MAKFDPHRIKTLKPIAKNIVMGDQVRETCCCAKFGADQWSGVFGGKYAHFRLFFV